MVLHCVPAALVDDFGSTPEHASSSLPTSPAPACLKSSRAPPHLTEDFQDHSGFEPIDFPETPSPSNVSGGMWSYGLQGGSCVVPRTPSPRMEASSQPWSGSHYNIAFNGQMQDMSVPYLLPAAHTHTTPAAMDLSSWEQGQQVPLMVWAPQAMSCASHSFLEAPQAPALQSCQNFTTENPLYQEIKKTLIDGGLKQLRSPDSRRLTHSPRRATIKTRWGVKEIEVVSSQASTADTTEALLEEGPEQFAVTRASFENSASRIFHDSDDSAFISDLPHGRPQILNLEQMLLGHTHMQTAETDLPPQLGSSSFPSIGSIGHHMGRCKPCAFVTRTGCSNAMHCNFCHLCEAGEKKRRRKEKKALVMARRRISSSFPIDGMSLPDYECEM